ncbi:hypothetical protein K7432_012118 [Basidiobolus ranarum]|uniref:Uncharacterized protein n=1 Tax=Basidiobolus ranarum TaxID=34480 RepID=A0ABR2WLC9_9FUNG
MDTNSSSTASTAPHDENSTSSDSVSADSKHSTHPDSFDSSLNDNAHPIAESSLTSNTHFNSDEFPVDLKPNSEEGNVWSTLVKEEDSSLTQEPSQDSTTLPTGDLNLPSSQSISRSTSNNLPETSLQSDSFATVSHMNTPTIKISPSFYTAAECGNGNALFEILNALVQETGYSPQDIINTPSSSTGLTVLHYAASRGHVILIEYLLDSGAEVDLTDREGETALLKAAYSGHLDVVKCLVGNYAVVHQQDKDGWTALHNACSGGHLEVVKWLLKNTAVDVNVRSKMNHTPLMNAASRGYLEIIIYLLDEADADSSIRNDFGEKAYDVAAARTEAQICEILDDNEKEAQDDYDTVRDHLTVLIILNENQRSPQTLLSRLASPRFSIGTLSEIGVHPWTLVNGSPTSKETIQLPFSNSETGLEEEWFWLTDWQIDLGHTKVDPEEGWQYAYSFDAPESKWYRSPPDAGLGSSWVRRRRWIRVMKRKLDVYNMHIDLPSPSQNKNVISAPIQLGEPSSSANRPSAIAIQLSNHFDCRADTNLSEHQTSRSLQASDRGSLPRSNTENAQQRFSTPTSRTRSNTMPSINRTRAPQTPDSSSSNTNTTAGVPSLSLRAANSSSTPLSPLSPSLWESDDEASDCRQCGRRFMLFFRRHHCRRCGLVFCDRCTSSRFPFLNPASIGDTTVAYQRACDTCFALLNSLPKNSSQLVTSSLMSRSNSQASLMNECPVCFTSLQNTFMSREAQERHVKECLEKREFNSSPKGPRYLVFKLKEDSNLLGQECPICFEEFEQGETLARLTCLCIFHRECIDSWFDRGKQCPFHSG